MQLTTQSVVFIANIYWRPHSSLPCTQSKATYWVAEIKIMLQLVPTQQQNLTIHQCDELLIPLLDWCLLLALDSGGHTRYCCFLNSIVSLPLSLLHPILFLTTLTTSRHNVVVEWLFLWELMLPMSRRAELPSVLRQCFNPFDSFSFIVQCTLILALFVSAAGNAWDHWCTIVAVIVHCH